MTENNYEVEATVEYGTPYQLVGSFEDITAAIEAAEQKVYNESYEAAFVAQGNEVLWSVSSRDEKVASS